MIDLKPLPTPRQLTDYAPRIVGVMDDDLEEEDHIITPETLRSHARFEPLVAVLAARRGEGKSATLTFVGEVLRRAWKASGVNAIVAANYHNRLADITDPMLVDELLSFPEHARDLIALVDEIDAYVNRRLWMRRTTIDFTAFLRQIRKRRIEMLCTTQQPGVLDDQVLTQVDLWIDVRRRRGGRVVDLEIYDWWGQFTGRWGRPKIPPEGEPTWHRRLWNVHNIWPYYDTNEVVIPMWSNYREERMGAIWSDMIEDAPEPPISLPEPATLKEYLMSLGVTFNTALALTAAKTFDRDIRTVRDLEGVIESLGLWTLVKDGPRHVTAVRKPAE